MGGTTGLSVSGEGWVCTGISSLLATQGQNLKSIERYNYPQIYIHMLVTYFKTPCLLQWQNTGLWLAIKVLWCSTLFRFCPCVARSDEIPVYTGQEDLVFCFHCNIKLDRWSKDMEPLLRHKEESPTCSFMRQRLQAVKGERGKTKSVAIASCSTKFSIDLSSSSSVSHVK